jgi:hypothetical protein
MATKKRRRRRKVEVKRNFRDPTAVLRFLLYLFAQWSHLGGAWRIMSFLRRSLRIVCCVCGCVREEEEAIIIKGIHRWSDCQLSRQMVFSPPPFCCSSALEQRVLLGGTVGVHDSQSYVKIKKKEIESQLVFKEILRDPFDVYFFFVPLRCCHSVNSIGLSWMKWSAAGSQDAVGKSWTRQKKKEIDKTNLIFCICNRSHRIHTNKSQGIARATDGECIIRTLYYVYR